MSVNLVTTTHNTLVYDFGTSSIKFGYGGYSRPHFRIPSASAQKLVVSDDPKIQFGEEWFEQDNFNIIPMIDIDGSFTHSNIFNTFMDWTYTECFGRSKDFVDPVEEIEPSDWGVLFSQPTCLRFQPEKFRERQKFIAEQSLEKFLNHPAVGFEHDSSLACYSFSRHTGVIVDFGWSYLRVVCVIEGHPYLKSVQSSSLGGCNLTYSLHKLLDSNGKFIKTRCDPVPTNSDGTGGFEPTESQLDFSRRGVLIDMIRTTLHFVPGDERISKYVYHMGREAVCGGIQDEIRSVADSIFEDTADGEALHTLVTKSILACPEEVQSQLWSSIMPTGGLSKLPGFSERLLDTLTENVPDKTPRIVEPVCEEASGENAVWVGGSILASYEGFSEMAISREEWLEHGESILNVKCL